MKTLFLSIAAAALLFACSPEATPTPTLDPSVPILEDGDAIEVVRVHLESTWHQETGQDCWQFMLYNTNYSRFGDEYLGDRTWEVTAESAKFWEDPLVWKVYETGGASGDIESPEWLKEQGCG